MSIRAPCPFCNAIGLTHAELAQHLFQCVAFNSYRVTAPADGFEEWWAENRLSIDGATKAIAELAWQAALRRAAEICREQPPEGEWVVNTLKTGVDICAQAITREADRG
jgi:hypothetical protein